MKSRLLIALLLFSLTASLYSEINLGQYYGFDPIEIIKLDWDISCLNICDMNNDGLNDLVVVNNRKSKIEILIQKNFNLSEIFTQLTSTDPVDKDNINTLPDSARFDNRELLVTVKITSMSCSDINSDGLIDIIYYGDPKGLYVHYQLKPDEGEIKFSDRIKFDISDGLSGQFSLDCGDVNCDGKNDVVLASKNYLYFLYQKNGKLDDPVKYPMSWIPLSIEIEDINGDGVNDILLLSDNKNKSFEARFGTKDGRLGPLVQYEIARPIAYELLDIDGKPSAEMLYIDQISGRLTGYRFENIFQPDTRDMLSMLYYPLETTNDSKNRDFIVGDFNGDKYDDIVISNPGSAEISVYLQGDNSSFSDPQYFGSYADISSTSAVDADGDGKDEIVVLSVKENSAGVSYFRDGRFGFPESISLKDNPVAMTVDDSDGDGKPEFICVTKDKDNARHLNLVRKFTEKEPEVVSVKLVGLSANPDGILCADIDGDGLKDFIIFIKYEKPITVRLESRYKMTVLDPVQSNSSLIKEANIQNTVEFNVDHSGGILLSQNNFIRHLTLNKDGKWQVINQFNANQRDDKIVSVGIGNLDKDANNEIVAYNSSNKKIQVFKRNRTENNTYDITINSEAGSWNGSAVQIAFIRLEEKDSYNAILFDGDKFAILDFTNKSKNQYPSIHKYFSYETQIRNGSYGRLAVGDINSDDIPDVVLVEYKKKHIEILTFNEFGSNPSPVSAMKFKVFEEKNFGDEAPGEMVEPRMVYVSDVTGDNANDIIAVIHDRIIIYPQDVEP